MTTINFITDNGQQIAVTFENISGLIRQEEQPFKLTNSMLEQIAGWQSNDDEYLNSDLKSISSAVVTLGCSLVDAVELDKPKIIGAVIDLSILHESLKDFETKKYILY